MIGKLIGVVILGMLSAVCFYSASVSRSGQDSQGFWMFLAFGAFFFLPMVLVIINLISQHSKAFKQIYDKLAGIDSPQTPRFVPHWFMMTAGVIVLICFLSLAVTIALKFFRYG